jgi:hypothetical protein
VYINAISLIVGDMRLVINLFIVVNWRLSTSNALETGHLEESTSFCNVRLSILQNYIVLLFLTSIHQFINSFHFYSNFIYNSVIETLEINKK